MTKKYLPKMRYSLDFQRKNPKSYHQNMSEFLRQKKRREVTMDYFKKNILLKKVPKNKTVKIFRNSTQY